MKKFLSLVLILFSSIQMSLGFEGASMSFWQSGNSERSMVSGGFGIGIGIFYPGGVNDYIADQTSHLIVTTGLVEMITNFSGKICVNVRPHQVIEISSFLEAAWAPKFIFVDVDNDYYFSFSKISPGISPKIHIPMGTGRHSFFFAPAVTFNFLKFKDGQGSNPEYKGGCLGGKIHAGFNLDFRKIKLVPFFGYDHAKTTGKEIGGDRLELSYSGAQLGVEILF